MNKHRKQFSIEYIMKEVNKVELYYISDNKLFPIFNLKASGKIKRVAWPRNSTSSPERNSYVKIW